MDVLLNVLQIQTLVSERLPLTMGREGERGGEREGRRERREGRREMEGEGGRRGRERGGWWEDKGVSAEG